MPPRAVKPQKSANTESKRSGGPAPARRLHIEDGFSEHAPALRAHFDERLADPRSARGDRFVWDYWHVPGQYTHLRTPAHEYFPKALYAKLHNELVAFGRSRLGCHDISPVWMSAYVEGCKQELHGDLPHGPFAFVLSLSPLARGQARPFQGGETMLLQEATLDYFRSFESIRSIERNQVLELIDPLFNRLTIFDGRIPHGVREVRGTHDPREGRLVLHGWFVSPRPFIDGPLPTSCLAPLIDKITKTLEHNVQDTPLSGFLALAIDVSREGRGTVHVLSDTTRVPGELEAARVELNANIVQLARSHVFPKKPKPSRIVLPLVFEAS
jgi:hypothetical protein